jgi:hypothetical protein
MRFRYEAEPLFLILLGQVLGRRRVDSWSVDWLIGCLFD